MYVASGLSLITDAGSRMFLRPGSTNFGPQDGRRRAPVEIPAPVNGQTRRDTTVTTAAAATAPGRLLEIFV